MMAARRPGFVRKNFNKLKEFAADGAFQRQYSLSRPQHFLALKKDHLGDFTMDPWMWPAFKETTVAIKDHMPKLKSGYHWLYTVEVFAWLRIPPRMQMFFRSEAWYYIWSTNVTTPMKAFWKWANSSMYHKVGVTVAAYFLYLAHLECWGLDQLNKEKWRVLSLEQKKAMAAQMPLGGRTLNYSCAPELIQTRTHNVNFGEMNIREERDEQPNFKTAQRGWKEGQAWCWQPDPPVVDIPLVEKAH